MSTEWFYTHRGNRVGPVSESQIKLLLSGGQLDGDVQVWRRGMKDWVSVRDSELSDQIQDSPPPLAGGLISNTWVWIIAFLLLVFALADAKIEEMKLQNLAASGWWNLRVLYHQGGLPPVAPKRPSGMPWGIPPAFYTLFGLLDERRLRKAGHSTK